MRSLLLLIFTIVLVVGSQAVDTAAQTDNGSGRVYWRGQVDDKLQITIQGLTVETKTISGRAMAEGNFSFTAKLPESDKTVSITKIEGRGKATVIQQPTAENDYTAIIEVHDDRGGASDYLLNIWW